MVLNFVAHTDEMERFLLGMWVHVFRTQKTNCLKRCVFSLFAVEVQMARCVKATENFP